MFKFLISILALFFFLLSEAGRAEAQERVALVIGNSAYKHTTPLANPRRDAEAMITQLEGLGFKVIGGLDLDRFAFEKKVREFSRALRTARIGLFYYAGHGLQVHGRNYLVPVDAQLKDEADLDFSMVEFNKVLRQMEHVSKTNLVFLDACRDNPLARNLARAMGLSRSTAIGRGMARVNAGIGTMITYATQPDNVALDGQGDNSPFTTALLKHMATPGLDISPMLRRVRREVIASTHGQQVPWNHSSLTQGFVFKAVPGAVAAAPDTLTASRPANDHLLTAYRETRRLGSCNAYKAFAKTYEKSFLALLAGEWIKGNCGEGAKKVYLHDGRWMGEQCVGRFKQRKATCFPRIIHIKKGKLSGKWGTRGKPRSGNISGEIGPDGRLSLVIQGRSSTATRSRRFKGNISGQIRDGRMEASGHYDTGRSVILKLSRLEEETAPAKPIKRYKGKKKKTTPKKKKTTPRKKTRSRTATTRTKSRTTSRKSCRRETKYQCINRICPTRNCGWRGSGKCAYSNRKVICR